MKTETDDFVVNCQPFEANILLSKGTWSNYFFSCIFLRFSSAFFDQLYQFSMVSKSTSPFTSLRKDSMPIWTELMVSFWVLFLNLVDFEDITDEPEDMLSKKRCLEHLLESRRTNFFTSTAPRLLNCICVSRIVKVSFLCTQIFAQFISTIVGTANKENIKNASIRCTKTCLGHDQTR